MSADTRNQAAGRNAGANDLNRSYRSARSARSLCAGMLATLLASAAAAQQVTEEIVVTARKVEESLQDVPLSITAFGADTIEAARILSLQDVADLTPGLSFFSPFGENLPTPVIRGVAPTDIFGETNAAIFVDGVYIEGREGLNFSQLDVERIEVVKGPQSALYGRTAFSGALNYVTKRPSEVFESRIDVEAGNDGKQKGVLMFSGPILGETLRGRASVLYDDWEGSYNNPDYPDNRIGGRTLRSLQGSLVWYPSDQLEVYGSLYHSNDEIDVPAVVGLAANCENRVDDDPEITRLLNVCGELPVLERVPSPGPGLIDQNTIPAVERALGEDRDLLRGILSVNLDLDVGTFTSLTGYVETEQSSFADFGGLGDYVPFLYCEGATIESPGNPNSCLNNPADQQFLTGILTEQRGSIVEEWSQELRFTSPQERRLRYTAGVYLYSSTSTIFDGGIINTAPLPGEDVGLPPFGGEQGPNFAIGTAIFYCGFTDDGCLDPLGRQFIERERDSWAVFTGVDFDFTERLTGRFEIRYLEQEERVSNFAYALCEPRGLNPDCGDDFWDLRFTDPIPFDPDRADETSVSASADFDSVTGRLGLDYRLNDDWMVYTSVATGDKPGGVQVLTPRVITGGGGTVPEVIVNRFKTEQLTAYEVGLKGATEDGRLRLDLAFFYNDWQDIVLRQIVEESPVTGRRFEQSTAFNFNAGTAKIFGWEASVDFAFTDNLTGRFTANWNDATLVDARQDSFEQFPSFAPDGDVSGNQLLRQPEWMTSATLDYRRAIRGDWEGFARLDANWQDKVYIGNDNQSWAPPRTVVNLRFGASTERFTLAVWVRNLFNTDEPIAAFRDIFFNNTDSITPPFQDLGPRPDFNKFPPFRYTVSYPALRTFGVTATFRFGQPR